MWTSKSGAAMTTDVVFCGSCPHNLVFSTQAFEAASFHYCHQSCCDILSLSSGPPGGEGHLELRQVTEAGESMQHHPNLPGRTPTTGTELNDKPKDKSSCFSFLS